MRILDHITPMIRQSFSSDLLNIPTPKFCDDSNTLYSIYQYIKRNLQRKTYRCPHQDMKFIEMEREFLDLYGRIKKQEDDFKEKTGESFQDPFDYFTHTPRRYKRVWEKIRFRR